MKLPFLFKEDGFGNSNCYSFLWIIAITFLTSLPAARIFSTWFCCISVAVFSMQSLSHFQLLLAPPSSAFPCHQSCFSSLPHRFLSYILVCHRPYLECFLKSVFRVLCSPPKRCLTLHFRHIHGHLLSPHPEVLQMTRDRQSLTSKIFELTNESDTNKENMVLLIANVYCRLATCPGLF